MCHCAHCHGRFFKLIATRCMPLGFSGENVVTLFYKKRCKRCKLEGFFRKEFTAANRLGVSTAITVAEWESSAAHAMPVHPGTRMTVFAGEYSRRASRGAEKNINYMKRGGGHAQSA